MTHTQWLNGRAFLDVVSKTFGGFRKCYMLQGLFERHQVRVHDWKVHMSREQPMDAHTRVG